MWTRARSWRWSAERGRQVDPHQDLTGAYRIDSGRILFDGQERAFASPADSQAAGIATIYQEINLAAQRSVAENIYLAREPRRFGFLDHRAMRDGAREILDTFNLDIDVDRPVAQFSAATRQMVAIARSVMQKAKLLIMDEPTSSLDEREVEILFRTIRTLKDKGVGVIFIGHRLDELYALCDRVTIMRDGQTVAVGAMADMPKMALVHHMLGRELAAFGRSAAASRLKTRAPHASRSPASAPGCAGRGVDLTVREGEISGLAGLLGSGRSETARIVFGVDPLGSGSLEVSGGAARTYREPADAIADGIGLVSEDRKVDGIVPDMSIRENMTLALLPRLRKDGIVDRAREDAIVKHFIAALRSNAPRPPTSRSRSCPAATSRRFCLPAALHRPESADRRRADAGHRHRRQIRNPQAAAHARRRRLERIDDFLRAGGAAGRRRPHHRAQRRRSVAVLPREAMSEKALLAAWRIRRRTPQEIRDDRNRDLPRAGGRRAVFPPFSRQPLRHDLGPGAADPVQSVVTPNFLSWQTLNVNLTQVAAIVSSRPA